MKRGKIRRVVEVPLWEPKPVQAPPPQEEPIRIVDWPQREPVPVEAPAREAQLA